MKASVLPIIAGAMTVSAQTSFPQSPFKSISNVLINIDPIISGWSGGLSTFITVLSAEVTISSSVEQICTPPGGIPIPQQPLPTQAEWIEDMQDLLKILKQSIDIIVGKEPVVVDTLRRLGHPILSGILESHRQLIPICVNNTRTAFDDSQGQQEAVDAFQGNATALLDGALQVYFF